MKIKLRAFSLLELLIAMSLMLIISTFLIYMWQNTMRTMQFSRSALLAHSQGRRINRLINETLQNTSGCYPLFAGNVAPTGNDKSCADIAGLDSFKVVSESGNEYGYMRGVKWAALHMDGNGDLYFDHDEYLPDYNSSPAQAYASVFATGRWTPSHEVYVNQTVLPTSLAGHSQKYMYRSIGAGKLSKRDITNDSVSTGTSEPTWPQEYGETIEDGGVTWMCVPPYLHFIPINIPNSTLGRIESDDILDRTNGNPERDHPLSSQYALSTSGLGVATERRITIFADNISSFSVTTSATHDIDGNAIVAPATLADYQANDEKCNGFLGFVDDHDGDLYTGYRGMMPQGRGYWPRFDPVTVPNNPDLESMKSPLQPRWIRVDFTVTGEISREIDEAALPVFEFTQILMLR